MIQPAIRSSGFTLLEVIIYIALFSLLFTGILVSTYPLFIASEHMTKNIAAEGEALFILSKIQHALGESIVSKDGIIVTPREGETTDELVLELEGLPMFHFYTDSSGTFCNAPLLCHQLLMGTESGIPLPLNAARISIENFSVTHTAPKTNSERYLEVSFTANSIPIGPVRYYVHF